MKAAAFEHERPTTPAQAIQLLGSSAHAKVLAGGQSLGPMLNLRLAMPELLVDVSGIPELIHIEDEGDSMRVGACVRHASIEDGVVLDATGGMMPRIARGIAYRAVRNRGTIGGSLAHADPSADWTSALAALGASVLILGPQGSRAVPVSTFTVGAFETVLASNEIVEAVLIPKLSPRARWGFYKVCRKPGELAEAIAAVVWEPERGIQRISIGATGSAPVVIEDVAQLVNTSAEEAFGGQQLDAAVERLLQQTPLGSDSFARKIHLVALRRALDQVYMQ